MLDADDAVNTSYCLFIGRDKCPVSRPLNGRPQIIYIQYYSTIMHLNQLSS